MFKFIFFEFVEAQFLPGSQVRAPSVALTSGTPLPAATGLAIHCVSPTADHRLHKQQHYNRSLRFPAHLRANGGVGDVERPPYDRTVQPEEISVHPFHLAAEVINVNDTTQQAAAHSFVFKWKPERGDSGYRDHGIGKNPLIGVAGKRVQPLPLVFQTALDTPTRLITSWRDIGAQEAHQRIGGRMASRANSTNDGRLPSISRGQATPQSSKMNAKSPDEVGNRYWYS